MKIAVFGGTGHVSKYLVDELIVAGHTVRLLSRQPVPNRVHVESMIGDALVAEDVRRVMEGCQVVVNCIGRLKNEGAFHTPITSWILKNMDALAISRYILVTNATVRLPSDSVTLFSWVGSLIFQLLFPEMLKDKQRELDMVIQSDVDWTVFRLPIVTDAYKSGTPQKAYSSLRGGFITNGAVARAIVKEIDRPTSRRTALYLFR